jgi:hypothetical protein
MSEILLAAAEYGEARIVVVTIILLIIGISLLVTLIFCVRDDFKCMERGRESISSGGRRIEKGEKGYYKGEKRQLRDRGITECGPRNDLNWDRVNEKNGYGMKGAK